MPINEIFAAGVLILTALVALFMPFVALSNKANRTHIDDVAGCVVGLIIWLSFIVCSFAVGFIVYALRGILTTGGPHG